MIVSLEPDYALISLPYLIYIGNVFIYMSSKEDKITERTNRDFNNTLNQQQDAINRTLDNTLHNIKRNTDEVHEKFHNIHDVLPNIKKKLFKL